MSGPPFVVADAVAAADTAQTLESSHTLETLQ
jgi:hypothetical protein